MRAQNVTSISFLSACGAQNAELKALPKTTQPTLVVLLVFGREELKRLFSQLYEAINAKPRSKFTLVIENNALRKVE